MKHLFGCLLALLILTPFNLSADTIRIDLPNMPPDAYPLELIRIPAGTFSVSYKSATVTITLTRDYYLSKTEITQAQWESVMGYNPCRFIHGPNYPVEMISYNDCHEFTQRINQLGLGEFRLPTMSEWVHAAKAGTTTTFYWGNDDDFETMNRYEWWQGNTKYNSNPVGMKLPNPWGLYDIGGNVTELCKDEIPYYAQDAFLTDPVFEIKEIDFFCSGGSFYASIPGIFYKSGGSTRNSSLPWMGFRLYKSIEEFPTPTPSPTPTKKPNGTPTPTPTPIPYSSPTPPPHIDFIGDLQSRYGQVRYTQIDPKSGVVVRTQDANFKALFSSGPSAISRDGTVFLAHDKIVRNHSGTFNFYNYPMSGAAINPSLHINGSQISYSVQVNPNQYEIRLYDAAQSRIVARRSHKDILNSAKGIYLPNETILQYAMSPDLQTMVFDRPTQPYRFVCNNIFDSDSKSNIFVKGYEGVLETLPLFAESMSRIFFHGYLTWQFTQIDHYAADEKTGEGWDISESLALTSTMWTPINYLHDVSNDGKTVLSAKDGAFVLIHETESGWDRVEPIGLPYKSGDRARISGDGTVVAAALQRHQDIWVGRPIFDVWACFKQADGSWTKLQCNSAYWAEPEFLFSKDGSRLYWTSVVPIPTPTPTPTPEPGMSVPHQEWLLHE